MSLTRSARFPRTLAVVYAVTAVSCALFGLWVMAAMLGVASVAVAITALVIHHKNHNERKTNGRYRKASEAHRARAGRGAGDGSRTGRGARGRAGAGMSIYGVHCGDPACALCGPLRWTGRMPISTSALLATTAPNFYSFMTNAPPRRQGSVGEFDGKSFAAGVVTGTRSFEVDNLGRLVGVSYREVWTPGENVAECLSPPDYKADGSPVEHEITECGHGFYGYYEGSNDYYEPGRVMGVVEAYGETVIGTRGFRASKARIVALHIPAEVSLGRRRLIVRNYPAIPLFDSFDAMVAEFPPDDAGNGVSPTTDPDFWTREA